MNADFFSALESGEASIEEAGRRYQLTINPSMQRFSQGLLRRSRVPWGAIVALEPDTGRVLVLAGYSEREKEQGGRLTVRSGFPAASLFKVVTASAAVEKSGLSGSTPVFFRGGNYTLNKYNYAPNSRLDRRKMDLASALGKSCNPVFGRVGLNVLSSAELSRFAQGFGFNQMIPFEIPVEMSKFTAPENDFEVARTAAGFGPAYVSPLHSALLAATVANGGTMMRPQLVSEVVDSRGRVIYQAQPQVLRHVLLETTADSVLEMMETTVSQGTARRYFSRWQKSDLGNIRVAAKTGTLRGPDPEGVYHWFIAAAPLRQPEIAVSCLVIDPGTARVGATALCREMMEQYFRKNRAEGRVVRSSKSPGKSVS
jgi:cell division protein FtsI/penicillin-binding protein 2